MTTGRPGAIQASSVRRTTSQNRNGRSIRAATIGTPRCCSRRWNGCRGTGGQSIDGSATKGDCRGTVTGRVMTTDSRSRACRGRRSRRFCEHGRFPISCGSFYPFSGGRGSLLTSKGRETRLGGPPRHLSGVTVAVAAGESAPCPTGKQERAPRR